MRAGLVVLRDLAMREAGANDPKSKLYKNRFHELLEQRAYRSAQMHPSIGKALLKCAELAPEIDEWHDRLDERHQLRLNHPINVLLAFRKAQDPPSPPDQPARTKHELEIRRSGRRQQLRSRAEINGSINCSNRSTRYRNPSTSPTLRSRAGINGSMNCGISTRYRNPAFRHLRRCGQRH